MLSIGAIIDDFHSSLSVERERCTDGETGSSLTGPASSGAGDRPISPTRRALTPSPWDNPKLYCRYPSCKKEFRSAFDLYHHTRAMHTDTRNFQRTITPSPTKTSGHRGPGGTDTRDIDPRRRPSPTRSTCSGILPDVPRAPQPSPDKYGVVWPVDVLRDQGKFQEAHELEAFRVHSAKLREYNTSLTMGLQEKQWALNKSCKTAASKALGAQLAANLPEAEPHSPPATRIGAGAEAEAGQ
jgi:hypothetical protein